MSVYNEMLGQTYTLLTVLELIPKKGRYMRCRCRCKCGAIVIKDARFLRNGNTKGCGLCKIPSPKRKAVHDSIMGEAFAGHRKRRLKDEQDQKT